MQSGDITELEKILHYQFNDIRLLKQALIHSSYINENGLTKPDCNERLEFFGDAVLEMVTSRYLFLTYPNYMEGSLSKMRASIVSEKPLAKVARQLRLGDFLYLGRGMEIAGGRDSDNVLSDAFEAVLAALYLDGGIKEAERLIERLVLAPLKTDSYQEDFKTLIQEMVQEQGGTIRYELISESGPDHDKTYTVQVYVNETIMGHGTGKSKKLAEMKAAENAYMKLMHQRPENKNQCK